MPEPESRAGDGRRDQSRPWQRRLDRIDEQCAASGVDVLVVASSANLRYLTGFTGSTAILATGPKGRVFITDGRYESVVLELMSAGGMQSMDVRRADPRYDTLLGDWLHQRSVGRAGFEAAHQTVAGLQRWRDASRSVDWTSTEGVVETLRTIKDDGEISVLRRAGRMLSDVARHIGDWVVGGKTERELARDVDRAIERIGFERPAFDTIIASGQNTAYPHAHPTDRRIGPGELVLLDFGGVLDGYCVDLTRMAAIGRVEPAASRLMAAVGEAVQAGIKAIRPGAAGSEVDGAARRVLEGHGLGEAFLHSTGHGLGLEVHEAPRLARAESGAKDVLAAGMVCTVEPGAYVRGLGGVRIEDDVLVTDGGGELLTDAPRELIVI